MRKMIISVFTALVLVVSALQADIPAPPHPVSNQTLTAFTAAVALAVAGMVTWVCMTVTQTHPVPINARIENAADFSDIAVIAYVSGGRPRVFRIKTDSLVPGPVIHRERRYIMYARRSWLDSSGLDRLSTRELDNLARKKPGDSSAIYPLYLLGEVPYEHRCGKSDKLLSEEQLYKINRTGKFPSLFLHKKTLYYPNTEESEVFEQQIEKTVPGTLSNSSKR